MTSEDLIAIINFLDERDRERTEEQDERYDAIIDILNEIRSDLYLIKEKLDIESDLY